MSEINLYQGMWPRNTSKTAKYSVRQIDGEWKVTVLYDLGAGMRYLAVENADTSIPDRVNFIKNKLGQKDGGVFYINEYQHLIVPIKQMDTSYYYFGGILSDIDFEFEFEGDTLTSRPVDSNGNQLKIGQDWIGPRPGIPYVLNADTSDIYYKRPAVSIEKPIEVINGVTQKVLLSKVSTDENAMEENLKNIRNRKGIKGGRFYVNEHLAIFAPKIHDTEDGLNYIYCGQIDMKGWFPEPFVVL